MHGEHAAKGFFFIVIVFGFVCTQSKFHLLLALMYAQGRKHLNTLHLVQRALTAAKVHGL